MSAAVGESSDRGNEIWRGTEVDETSAEGCDELLLLLAAVDADNVGAAGKTVLDCVLAYPPSVIVYIVASDLASLT